MDKEQSNKYTISELVSILNTPDNVVRKKVKIYQFPTDKEVINNRLIDVVFITTAQINALKQEIEINKQKYKVRKDQINTDPSVLLNQPEIIEEPKKETELNNDSLKLLLEELRYYSNRLIEKSEDSVKFLTSDNEFYKNKYFELQYEANQIKSDNELLKKQLEELQNKIKQLEETNQKQQTELSNSSDQLKKLQEENAKLKQELDKKSKWQFWK